MLQILCTFFLVLDIFCIFNFGYYDIESHCDFNLYFITNKIENLLCGQVGGQFYNVPGIVKRSMPIKIFAVYNIFQFKLISHAVEIFYNTVSFSKKRFHNDWFVCELYLNILSIIDI